MVLVLLCVIVAGINRNFLSFGNFVRMSQDAAIPLVLGIGETFIILMGSIDLSVEGVLTLAALAAAHARGVAFDDLIKFAPSLHPVPGRFQPVDGGQPFTVIVDYAHTDDALRNLIALARQAKAHDLKDASDAADVERRDEPPSR